MMTFTVHEPPAPDSDRVDRADKLEFVKDGFSWLTAISPPLGFIAKSLWIAAFAYIVLVSAVAWLLAKLGVGQSWIGLVMLALNVYLGFEISTLKRWSLDRAGWKTVGVVMGRSLPECERRFFEGWLPEQPVIAAPKSPGPASGRRHGNGVPWPFGSRA